MKFTVIALLLCSSLPMAQDPGAPKRVRVGATVMETKIEQRVDPVYPSEAREIRLQGTVRLEVLIDKEGAVSSAKVVMGHPLLVSAATDAVMQWRYEPTLLNGEPVEVVTNVDVKFALDEQPAKTSADSAPAAGKELEAATRGQLRKMEPAPVTRVEPAYPAEARAARIQGTVVLDAVIGKDGAVKELAVVSGHRLLNQAALDAVGKWKYKPILINGEPVEASARIEVEFKLPPAK